MISEESIERAVNWLSENAAKAAQARANRVYMEEYRKTLKAKLMCESDSDSLGGQERYAYSHDAYVGHLAALKEAIKEDEKCRYLIAAAEAKISAWQTQTRIARAQERVT